MEYINGHSYLINLSGERLYSITVNGVTEKSLLIRWNKGLESYDEWQNKKYFNKYSIHEDITDFYENKVVE